MSDFFDRLCAAAGGAGRGKKEEEMKKHTTFRVGGPARYFVSPAGKEALAAVLRLCRKEGMPYYILGNGSNLLVSDQGYDGVMILMGDGFLKLEKKLFGDRDDVIYTVGAGLLLSRIAKEALEDSLTGFEFAAGIPGTLGGAVVMNAGAYGGEMKDIIRSVRVMDPQGNLLELDASQMDFAYRHSCVLEKHYIVLSAELELRRGDKAQIQAQMEDLAARRREKQPLEYPSAGSTFKRPAGYFAGKLIQDAGLRGFRVGGAQVSEKHCGFVINREQATAEDIRTLCHEIQKKVKDTFGVDLECEIRMLGWAEPEEGKCGW
ncbi:MAG: UDP-N-acetylmuramate dehydrogenase [Oscillospiraceae bacterium]|nr:UDP-N-acetylmuramate dehydrogenase [Oscillospiraceae bacterium]